MKLVIDRSKWLRGEGSVASSLLRASDGKMCCLGFLGIACGLSQNALRGRAAPSCVQSPRHKLWPAWLLSWEPGATGDVEAELMEENDGNANESRIAAILAKYGVEVEFIDGEGGA